MHDPADGLKFDSWKTLVYRVAGGWLDDCKVPDSHVYKTNPKHHLSTAVLNDTVWSIFADMFGFYQI